MAILKQDASDYAIYNGWYGNCDQDSCEPFNLIPNKNIIFATYQFKEHGTGTATFSSLVADIPGINSFDELVCGHSYFIVLSPGTSEVDIPNFVYSEEASSDLGRIIETCAELPTPTPDIVLPVVYELETDKSEVVEGQEITITLKTQNVPTGTTVNYIITHPLDANTSATGEFVVGVDGTSSLVINPQVDANNS